MASEAINNSAAVRTLSSMADIGYATHLKSASDASNSTLVLPKLYVGGQPALFEVDNEHMFIAFSQSPEILSDAVKLMGVFARTLRAGVTLSPEYVIRQVVTDAQRAAFSGVDNRLEAAARSLINFPSSWFSLAFNKETKFMRDLRRKGVIGDIDYNPVNTTELLLYDTKAVQRSPIGAVVHRLEQVTKASDIAARLAVYEQTIKETGDVSLAERHRCPIRVK